MDINSIFGYIIGSVGAFIIVGSILNLDFLIKSKRAEFYIKMFGAIGARIFYLALGAFLIYIALQIINAT
jgi:hypothetical protein